MQLLEFIVDVIIKLKTKTMKKFGELMAMFLLSIPIVIMNGLVFCKLWMWFIIPTFEVQPLRIIEAIGIVFLINFVRANPSKKSEDVALSYRFFVNIIFALLVLGIGWIASQFM